MSAPLGRRNRAFRPRRGRFFEPAWPQVQPPPVPPPDLLRQSRRAPFQPRRHPRRALWMRVVPPQVQAPPVPPLLVIARPRRWIIPLRRGHFWVPIPFQAPIPPRPPDRIRPRRRYWAYRPRHSQFFEPAWPQAPQIPQLGPPPGAPGVAVVAGLSGQYRYLIYDLLSGAPIDELPLFDVDYSHVLNRAGAFKGSMLRRDPKARRATLFPSRTALYVERNHELVWGGILWTIKAPRDSDHLEFGGEGFWSYYHQRFIRTARVYTNWEQMTLATDLVSFCGSKGVTTLPGGSQAGDAGGLLTPIGPFNPSPVVRTEAYWPDESRNVGDTVEALAALDGGFDFSIEVYYDQALTPRRLFQPWYPAKGIVLNDARWDLESALRTYDDPIDGKRQANQILGRGSGSGDTALLTVTSDASQIGSAYPLLERVADFRTALTYADLNAHCVTELAKSRYPVETPTLYLAHVPDTEIGTFATGDWVQVVLSDGWVQMAGQARIQAWGVKVPAAGMEEPYVTLDTSMLRPLPTPGA